MRNSPARSFVLAWFAAATGALAQAPAQPPTTASPPQLRLHPLLDGLRGDPGDLDKEAAKVGIDLKKPDNPLVAWACKDGRLFYVFYKSTEEAFSDRAWMLQRIRKVERTWATKDATPEEKVTYQVEAFKTQGGALKGPDQHFGSFGLRGAHRREVVKEYEIGFGELPGEAAGAAWPFAANRLFHMLQAYGDDRAIFDKVQFVASRRWTLTVAFGADGSYAITSPELGLDLPKNPPKLEQARAVVDPASKALVLEAGVGPAGLTVGKSVRADVDKVLGVPLEDVPTGPNRNVSYRGGLTCNFAQDGVLNTVFTRACFGGRTKEGIVLGMARAEVKKKLGKAAKDFDDGEVSWTVPGLHVHFDALGQVVRLVVARR